MKTYPMNNSLFAQRFWYLIVSLTLGVMLSVAASIFLPCHWFGSSFEGSCGMAIYLLALFFGLILGLVIFAGFYRMTANRKDESPQARKAAIRRHSIVFWTCLVLSYVALVTDSVELPLLTRVGIIWTTVELSVRMKRSALTPVPVFVPVIGYCIVAWILFNDKLARKKSAAKGGDGKEQLPMGEQP